MNSNDIRTLQKKFGNMQFKKNSKQTYTRHNRYISHRCCDVV